MFHMDPNRRQLQLVCRNEGAVRVVVKKGLYLQNSCMCNVLCHRFLCTDMLHLSSASSNASMRNVWLGSGCRPILRAFSYVYTSSSTTCSTATTETCRHTGKTKTYFRQTKLRQRTRALTGPLQIFSHATIARIPTDYSCALCWFQ